MKRVNSRRLGHRSCGSRCLPFIVLCAISSGLPTSLLLAQDLMMDLDAPAAGGNATETVTATATIGLPSVKAPLSGYTVPAFGSQRVLPNGSAVGITTNAIDIVAAQGETESVSFVLHANANIQKLVVAASDLTSPSSKSNTAKIDLRLVKCWFQSGNAWFTTEGDPEEPTLVPELLLHDDGLITSDFRDKKNHYRVQGKDEPIVASPSTAGTLPDDDAATLQPLALRANQTQQFWLTVQVPNTMAPGIYQGQVSFTADGQAAGSIAMALRVLPFELPVPRPRTDFTRTFNVILAHGLSLQTLNADRAKAEIRLRAALADMVQHQVLNPLAPDVTNNAELAKRELELRKEVGISNEPLWIADATASATWLTPSKERFEEASLTEAAKLFALASQLVGHKEIYLYLPTGKNAPADLTEQLEKLKMTGAKLWLPGDEATINTYGYLQDAHQYHQMATPRQIWTRHRAGSRVLWGGTPSPGVENPEYWRRQTGVVPFHAGYDGVTIAGYSEPTNPWVDDAHGYTRSRSLVYPTASGWISTLAWEAVRKAINDVRYLTLLNELIEQCRASQSQLVVIEGRRASLWLHLAEVDTANLDTLRLNAIAWILKLKLSLATVDGKDAP